MMNLTTKTFKTFLLFKRSLILLCFVSYALVVKADIGDYWYAQYRVKVSLTNRSTGSGTVYMKADNTNGNSETVTLPDKNNTQITVRSARKRVTNSSSSYTHTFTNITLVAEAMPGSEFVGWEETNLSGNSAVIETSQYYNLQEYDAFVDGDPYPLPATVVTYHPIFTAYTYYAYNQPSDYEVITIDQSGNIISDDLMVTATPSFQLATRGPDGITLGQRSNVDANVFSQLADNRGKLGQASYIWDITAHDAPCHTYYGWKTASGNYNDVEANNKACSVTTTSRDVNNPAQHKVYVVYKRDPFNLMEYDADNHITAALAMPYSMENGIQTYTENIPGAELDTKYYRLVLGATGDVEVTSDGDFSASLGDEDGKQILIVTPDNNAQEGTIYISVGGTQIAELHLTVNVKPVFVTLNPAEDLTGTYTYTQSTTGTQVFSVTTSPIVKQMVTATDYSFSFSPTPQDASKYQFDRWIIRDAEENIIAEYVEPNLTHTFKGDESITPVFTAIDRAVFIVKSEPNVKYVDLQKALDRAAALGSGQVVVVTVEGNRKGGRLVQGDYVIRNGVTLLVPGESTYTPIVAGLKEGDFGSSGTFGTFCTLTVEDNTTITAENGNISVYAKVATTNSSRRVGVWNHGRIHLGKNCHIEVKKGGLYCFGFITGDNTSHVIMDSLTTVYEPFHMTDWRGGNEMMFGGILGNSRRVFPAGQYYVQACEVPLTLKAGATEYLSILIETSFGNSLANVQFVSNYSSTSGLFGLGGKTSLTKYYDPNTDRLHFEFNGNGTASKVKLGNLSLKVSAANVNSEDYVMPIQNNLEVDVKNTTIDVTCDVALMPGTVMRVHDDAVINIQNGVRVYVYDRGARKLREKNGTDNGGYWGASNSLLIPIPDNARPGGVIYGHKNDKGAFVKGRNEEDLLDAQLVVNGVMNVHGALYTVKGPYANEDINEPEGGADITSEGSGKVNIYNIGTDTTTYQWKQGSKAQSITMTETLLLHNDISAGATAAYTAVKNENNQNLTSLPLSYTYYQHDGTWRLPEAGITSIKLYDSENNEIDSIIVTLPNADVTGYLLATLESIGELSYSPANFEIPESVGNVTFDKQNVAIIDGKLKIPFTYETQDKHGIHTADLTITYTKDAAYTRTLTMPIVVKEDYTPIFTASTDLNIYGRVGEENPAALPIQPAEKNVTTLSEDDEVNIEWMANMTGSNPDQFAFKFGEGEGNMLSGARVIFKPTTEGQKKATLTLTATYTDANDPAKVLQKVHTVTLVGYAMKIANTLDFNDVGTITINTEPFELLRGINSPEQITVTTEQVGTDVPSDVADITPVDASQPNTNYTFTPKAVGQLKVKVSQVSSNAYEGITNPVLEKIFMVVANPRPLTEVSCASTETDFRLLTANMSNVAYDNAQIQFASTEAPAVWTAQFASMPGTLTFTPHGSGHWAIQESKDGKAWSEMMWWTQLPNSEEVTIPLTPSSRYLQIQYIKSDDEDYGYITDLCINPFSIHAETTKLYVPVEGGVVRSTSIVFTHVAEPANIQIVGPANWTVTTNLSGNLGGLKNPYYQTTVTLSGGQNVEELNNGFTLTAKQTTDNATATVTLATFNFPKPLPMQSALWISDDDVDNVNGYDEAEYYYLYLHESEYAKWDAENQTVVFMNRGSHVDANRRVAFGYHGLPAHVRFQSLTTDWTIEEGVETTEGVEWTPTNTETRVITSNNGINTITQPINHTSKFVRISYVGTEPSEVTIQNVVIEGFPSATAPAEVEIAKANDQATPSATFDIHVMNLPRMQLVLNDTSEFRLLHGDVSNWAALTNADTISTSDYPEEMKMNEEGYITIKVEWKGKNLVNEGYIKIINPDQDNKVMATVRLVGKKDAITLAEANTGIWTGVPDGVAKGRPTPNSYTLVGATGDNKVFDAYPYHEVNIKNAFDVNGNALFNYVVIYGETTTKDGSRTITRPTSTAGSNAKTPYYIYERDSIDGKSYRFVQAVEDANSPYKADLSEITHFTEFVVGDVKYYAIQPKNGDPLSFYMTGFCPYATTGSTKDDEGVWYFRGDVNDSVHIYLEDCHLYSRTKSLSGHNTSKTGDDSPDFTEDMVKGSGAVLVFENANPQQNNDSTFNVAIHTRGHNVLKSNFGCYYTFLGMAKATQISSPVQVRLGAANHFQTARTTLDFDDLWPLSSTLSDHTNGFLSLQKQANNAPSIDLGNANTIVNFRGGQIQLQNAQVGSPNYKTTLAISYRSGLMGNVKIQMAYGIGTDDVGGTVNFYDGTTTVLPMKVDAAYRSFYLMDTETLKDQQGNDSIVELPTTSCLRTPTKTYVYGGSHCMMRACNHVTSKGGAPKDGPSGQLLGRYVYNNTAPDQGYDYRCVVAALPEDVVNYQNGYEVIFENKKYVMEDGEWNLVGDATFTDPCYLVTPTSFPGELTIQSTGQKLLDYYENYPNGEYGLHSISPDANGNLSFWVPAGVVPGVSPEQDKQLTGWKACMTEIVAGAFGITGSVGGDVSVEFNEEVTNLLYCQLDDNIYSVISDRTKIGVDSLGNEKFTYNYKAPVVDPTGQLPDSLKYQYLPPTHVGDSAQYRVFSEEDYTVTNYLYYITTAQADKWMNFTMPFDVDTIWVVEAYSEKQIEAFFMKENKTVEEKKVGESDMDATLRFQARHNADFAAFFGVAMAIGDDKRSFEDIYKSYIGWAKNKADVENGLYTSGTYDLRGKYPLTHYDGTNFQSSNFYLYHNKNTWYQTESDQFDTQWEIVPAKQKGKPLMKAGETYSLLFPYCLGCDVELDEDNNIVVDEFGLPVRKTRDYWDYWSGKFLIFQSTKASQSSPHIIKGSNYIAPNKVEDNPWLFDKHPTDPTQAILTGNSTFMLIDVNEYAKAEHVYEYISDTYYERYLPLEKDQVTKKYPTLTPTTTFLLNGNATRAKMVTREGKIIYDTNPDDGGDENQGTPTGNIPTVGGGNDLFITSTATGINIAVAQPQQVRVLSSTGAVIFSGMVQTAVDVLLPTTGVYVITGENEVHKILH